MAGGAVFKPPHRAAIGLLEWGIDLWPYINGKALVSGLQLASMNASDMLDVLHFFFEEDLNYSTAEQAEAVSKVREMVYRDMYGLTYKYAYKQSKNKTKSFDADDDNYDFDDLVPYDPTSNSVKPYIPPTEFDAEVGLDFGMGNIEPPLN